MNPLAIWLAKLLQPIIKQAVDAVYADLKADIAKIPDAVEGVIASGLQQATADAEKIIDTVTSSLGSVTGSISALQNVFNPVNLAKQIADQLPSLIPHLFTPGPHSPSPLPYDPFRESE